MSATPRLGACVVLLTVFGAIAACSGSSSAREEAARAGKTSGGAGLPAIVGSPDLALRRAALEGQTALVASALAGGADASSASVDGVTALMLAASKGNRSIVETLLQKGARLEATTRSDKVTALMMAANWGHTAVVDLLIERGAAINAQDSSKRNVLDWAGMDKSVNREDAKALQVHLKEKGAKSAPKDALDLLLSVGSMPDLAELIKRATEENPEVKAERVGGDVTEPKRITHVPVAFPDAAMKAGPQGVVILEVTVGADGRVRNVKVLRGEPLLSDAAVAAVKQWTYEPPVVRGSPAPVAFTVVVPVRQGK
jgi:TonB family protein